MRWVSWGHHAGVTALFALDYPNMAIFLLVALFAMFSLAGGIGSVIYADNLGKAIPATRRGRFVGWKQLVGYALVVGAGWVVVWILANPEQLPYPTHRAVMFALAAVFLLVALGGTSLVKEPSSTHQRETNSPSESLKRALHFTGVNVNFRRLLGARELTGVLVPSAPFFVVHALEDVGILEAAIGLYLATRMASAALSNLLLGGGSETGSATAP